MYHLIPASQRNTARSSCYCTCQGLSRSPVLPERFKVRPVKRNATRARRILILLQSQIRAPRFPKGAYLTCCSVAHVCVPPPPPPPCVRPLASLRVFGLRSVVCLAVRMHVYTCCVYRCAAYIFMLGPRMPASTYDAHVHTWRICVPLAELCARVRYFAVLWLWLWRRRRFDVGCGTWDAGRLECM